MKEACYHVIFIYWVKQAQDRCSISGECHYCWHQLRSNLIHLAQTLPWSNPNDHPLPAQLGQSLVCTVLLPVDGFPVFVPASDLWRVPILKKTWFNKEIWTSHFSIHHIFLKHICNIREAISKMRPGVYAHQSMFFQSSARQGRMGYLGSHQARCSALSPRQR